MTRPLFAALTVAALALPARAGGLEHVPADALAFTHIKLADLWKSASAAPYREAIFAAGQEAVDSLDANYLPRPSSIDTVTVFQPGPLAALKNGNPSPLAIVTTNEPMDIKAVIKAWDKDAVPVKAGRPTAANRDGGAAVTFPDDRTMVIGTPEAVKAFGTKRATRAGALAEAIKQANDQELTLAVNWAAVPVDDLAAAPEQLQPIIKAKRIVMGVRVGKKSSVELAFAYESADEAESAETAMRLGLSSAAGLLGLARPFLTEMLLKKNPDGALEGLPEATAGLLGLGGVQIIDDFLNDPPLSRDGATVAMRADLSAVGATGVTAGAGVAIGLLLPAVQKVREAAARMSSQNNLKQIGLALHSYHDVNGQFPPPAIYSADGKPLASWRVLILPYLEQDAIFKQWKMDEPWDGPNNKRLSDLVIRVYAHPSAPGGASNQTYYQAFTGNVGANANEKFKTLFQNPGVRINAITDGTSNSIMAAEAAVPVPWAKPDDLRCAPGKALPPLGGLHAGGYNILMGDGSVRFLTRTLDENTLRALISIDGGEVVNIP